MVEDLSSLYLNSFASIQDGVRKDNQLTITCYDLKEYLYNSNIYICYYKAIHMLYLEYYI